MTASTRRASPARLLVVALALSACTSPASTTSTLPSEGPPTSSRASTVDPTTVASSSYFEPAVVLETPAPSPFLPMAAGPDRIVLYEPPFLVTHTVDGTRSVRIPEHAPGVGEFIDVSSLVHWQDRYWAFLIGDLTTELGRATALVSEDGESWKRVDVGPPVAGARMPNGFATPDVPQYAGSSGVQAASASETQLVAAGWTRTDAGVQPVVWSTGDGTTWSARVPPTEGSERELAAAVAAGGDAVLVHTLGSTYVGQDLFLLGPDGERDVSLAGEQVVASLVRSADGFLLSSHASLTPPVLLWEWDGDAWNSIERPDLVARQADDLSLRPFLLAGSVDGAIAAGVHELAIRDDGGWRSLGSVQGRIVSMTAGDEMVRVVSSDGASTLITEIPLS